MTDASLDDLSDAEDEILQQLQAIRELKEAKRRQQTNLVNSDDEEDPRQINDVGQQPSYFHHRPKSTHNEKLLRRKIEEENAKKDSETFATKLSKSRNEVKEMSERQRQFERDILAERIYSFDLENHKPINETVNEKDPYSGKYLSKRYVPKKVVDKMLKNMKLMRVENVFAEISAPKYAAPHCANFIVVGVVTSKSDSLSTSSGRRSKYMKVHISNFRQQVTLSLFDAAFKRYWKLRVGDVIAILNPHVWPYKSKEESGFTLFLKEDTRSILEMGRARDFGYCKSIKKDGTRCTVPIDTSKSEYCEYHIERAFKKTASQRVELGSNVQMFAPTRDGVREAIFLGSKQGSGSLVVDSLAPHLSTRTENSFSSPEASKAFFDSGFTNPKFLPSIEADKHRIQRLKEEKKLRRKISKISGAENLGGQAVETKTERKRRTHVTREAFSPGAMTKIGFNPTRRLFEKNREYDKKVATDRTRDMLTSLKNQGKKSHKLLKPSKTEEALRKKQKRETFAKYQKAEHVIELSDSDSDLDIEGETNAFMKFKRDAGRLSKC